MPFSIFLSLLLVLSSHQPVAFGSGTSRAQPGVGLATRSLDSTVATTFNYNNYNNNNNNGDEVGATGNKYDFRFSGKSALNRFRSSCQVVSRFVQLSHDEEALHD